MLPTNAPATAVLTAGARGRRAAYSCRVAARTAPRVLFSFPTRLGTTGIGTTAWHQVTGLAAAGVEVHVVCGSLERPAPGVRIVAETMRVGPARVPYRALGPARARAWHDRRTARAIAALRGRLDV